LVRVGCAPKAIFIQNSGFDASDYRRARPAALRGGITRAGKKKRPARAGFGFGLWFSYAV